MSGADLALQDTGSLAAAGYGRLAMRAQSPLFSALGAAATVASFSFSILAFVCHAYSAFVRTPSSFLPRTLKSLPWFRFCFFSVLYGRLGFWTQEIVQRPLLLCLAPRPSALRSAVDSSIKACAE